MTENTLSLEASNALRKRLQDKAFANIPGAAGSPVYGSSPNQTDSWKKVSLNDLLWCCVQAMKYTLLSDTRNYPNEPKGLTNSKGSARS